MTGYQNSADRVERMAASKKLTRYKLHLQNSMFYGNVIWCRTAYGERETDTVRGPNQHTFYELHYALEGSLDVWLEDGRHEVVQAGEFVLFPPHYRHLVCAANMQSEKLVCGLTVDSDVEFVRKALEHLEGGKVYPASPAMPVYVEWMLHNAMNSKAGTATVLNNLLECLIMEVFRQISPDSMEKTEDRKVFENDLRIREMEEYIDRNISTAIRGEQVAQRMNISLRHLNRLTEKYLGCSVGKLIARKRMFYIRELLFDHTLTLRDIAEQAGFPSEYALSRFFKEHEGMTIGAYRRSLES